MKGILLTCNDRHARFVTNLSNPREIVLRICSGAGIQATTIDPDKDRKFSIVLSSYRTDDLMERFSNDQFMVKDLGISSVPLRVRQSSERVKFVPY